MKCTIAWLHTLAQMARRCQRASEIKRHQHTSVRDRRSTGIAGELMLIGSISGQAAIRETNARDICAVAWHARRLGEQGRNLTAMASVFWLLPKRDRPPQQPAAAERRVHHAQAAKRGIGPAHKCMKKKIKCGLFYRQASRLKCCWHGMAQHSQTSARNAVIAYKQ